MELKENTIEELREKLPKHLRDLLNPEPEKPDKITDDKNEK